ncbi:hypothetical protein KQH40_00095 [bacterium]|nr:hypothetical protein [bacterium]
MRQDFSPGAITAIYRRGIYWCSQNNLLAEAIRLAIEIKDFETAVVILQNEFDTFYNQPGMQDLVSDWISKFPIEVIRWNQKIWYGYALMLFKNGNFTDAAAFLAELWDHTSSLEDLEEETRNTILGHKALLESILIRHISIDYPNLYHQAKTAHDLLPKSEQTKSISAPHFISLQRHSSILLQY